MSRWLFTVLGACALLTPAATRAGVGLDERPANPTCVAPPRPASAADIGVVAQRVFSFLNLSNDTMAPMALRQSPTNPAIWYLAERRGTILRLDDSAHTQTTLLDIAGAVHSNLQDANDEGGMLGMALHPDFAANGEIFVFYTAALDGFACAATVSRFRSLDGGLTIDPASEEVVLSVPKLATHHHGGALEFGPDRKLYISIGDDLRGGLAQDPNTKYGKILRIDVDAGTPYAIPPDNPFAASASAQEVWAYGFRNPYRFTFDAETGELWVGEVGDQLFEEVNVVQPGGNYGWPVMEGSICRSTPNCNQSGKTLPVYAYDHGDGAPCWAVIGGFVYRGSAYPELFGHYVFSDWCHYDVRALFSDGNGSYEARKIGQFAGLFRSFAEDSSGELYALRTRQIDKLVRATPPDSFPRHLSETGCVDPADPSVPASGLIPYSVNAPLWSDGAEKDRWMALPDGTTIDVQLDGDWDLPIGSVLMKNFSLADQLIETRLFTRHDDGGWAGYSYEWNEDGTDADLLEAAKVKQFGDQTWLYPSRSECLQCHTEAAGYTLGPATAQLNGSAFYESSHTWASQLDTLEHIGVFSSPPEHAQRISTSDGSIEERARAYLHANCAHCHAPGAPAQASIDFRYTTRIEDMHLCGVVPGKGDLGVSGARLVVPGDPATSIVSLRMHALDAKRMPPLATGVVDPFGTELVDAWIRSLVAEPDGSCVTRGPACNDGFDNDDDGLVDYPMDPGCADATSKIESPKCQDGIDNDHDGRIDFDGGAAANHGVALGPIDPRCTEASRNQENPGCGLGAEVLLPLALFGWLRARRA